MHSFPGKLLAHSHQCHCQRNTWAAKCIYGRTTSIKIGLCSLFVSGLVKVSQISEGRSSHDWNAVDWDVTQLNSAQCKPHIAQWPMVQGHGLREILWWAIWLCPILNQFLLVFSFCELMFLLSVWSQGERKCSKRFCQGGLLLQTESYLPSIWNC